MAQGFARQLAKMFARTERNGDGRAERAELAARADQRFERADADGDGRVTVEEIRVRWQARRDGHEGEAHPVD